MCSVAKSCLTLCNPLDCSPPGSSVHGTLQARILEWIAIYWSELPFPLLGDLPNPGIEPTSPASPALVGRFFTTEPAGELRKVHGLLLFLDFYQELLSEAKL